MLTSLCVSTMLQSTWRHSHRRNSPEPSPRSSLAPPMGTEDFGANESESNSTEQGCLSSYLCLSATLSCCPLGGLGCSAMLSPRGESNRRANEPFTPDLMPWPPISRRSHSDGPPCLTFQAEECHYWFPRIPTRLVTPTFLSEMSHREKGYEARPSQLNTIAADGKRDCRLLSVSVIPTSGGRAECQDCQQQTLRTRQAHESWHSLQPPTAAGKLKATP